MGFQLNTNVLNQKGSPAIYTDTFANRPAFGYAGRLFISNDTAAIYEDTGTAWVLIANVSSGAGTLQQVTTNGNTSNVGISVTAGGVSTNSATITSLTTGSVPFVGAAGLITQDNPNLFWDDTNNRLGINTNTPGNSLDVHTAGTNPILALNNTAGNQSAISFLNSSVQKWRVGNSATNTFDIFNPSNSTIAISIDVGSTLKFITSPKIKNGTGLSPEAGFGAIGFLTSGVIFQRDNSANKLFFDFSSFTAQRTYLCPNADGTLALTSDLSAYLPLSGGTLTGPLNGTSAVFSSTVQGSAYYLAGMTAGGGALYWVSDRVTLANYNATGQVVIETNGGAVTATFGGATYNNDFVGTGRFTGALNGTSATFTDSVTARNGSNGIAFTTTNAVDADFTVETVSGGTTKLGTSGNKLSINSNGGNVGIGVIPSAFGSGFTGFQVGAQGSHQAITTNYQVGLNYFYNGTDYKAIQTGASSKIEFDVDTIRFKNAPSVSAGSTQTFTERLSINASGVVTVSNLAGTGSRAVVADATGILSAPVSDETVKENIQTLQYGLNTIMQLNPISFEYIDEYKNYGEGLQIGNIAQDVAKVIPEAVFTTPSTGLMGINYNQFDGIYIKAIQELNNKIDSLLQRIELLENK